MLRPFRDFIVVKPIERVKSDVIAVVMSEEPNQGEVVAAGPGHYNDKNVFIPNPIKPGQKVRFGTVGKDEYLKYRPFHENGEKFLIMSWKDVCFIEENENAA